MYSSYSIMHLGYDSIIYRRLEKALERLSLNSTSLYILLIAFFSVLSAKYLDSRLVPPPSLLGAQQSVKSINPKMGVHTRLTDEVEEVKIKQTLVMVREMGATWIVEYFPWAYVEPEPGVHKWRHTDQVIQHADRQGLKIIARLGFVPEWARPPETTPLYLDETNFVDFGHYVATFTKRYKEEVDYIIIWNEPNLGLEWGYQPASPEKYTNMLRQVYPMIKVANPDVQVLAGALAPTLAGVSDSSEPQMDMNDLLFLQRMYDAGAANYFDILAVHSYGWNFPPDEPANREVINLRRTELMYDIMVENGDGHKHVMITEGGWNDHPRWTRAVRPSQRIEYTIRAYEIAQTEWPWLESINLWVFRYPWDAKSYQDYYTFVRTDFEPKPLYLEVQRYAAGE